MGVVLLYNNEENRNLIEASVKSHYNIQVESFNLSEISLESYKFNTIIFEVSDHLSEKTFRILDLLPLELNCIGISDKAQFKNPKIKIFTLESFVNSKSQIVEEILNQRNQRKEDILIKINDKYKRIRFKDIEYIKGDGKYITLILNSREYSVRTSLKHFFEILPEYFLRIHGSYIINIKKIESINVDEQSIQLSNCSVPFSRKFKSKIFNQFHIG